ncbi:hypothetical protein [Olleya namhaensis]|uniref:hypothetical protein n=1 Tax=Olleya namhaensis TaxID=1144750 RepID=UPI00232AC905|nr:hypothetical protein [Olleya namhaensis]
MKKLIILALFFIIYSCKFEEKPTQKDEDINVVKDKTIVKPIEKWDVNKVYDEFGNLKKYDSVYSWSYSNIKGDSLHVNLDSIMDSFKGYFEKNTPFIWQKDFSYFPENDTLFMNNFFKSDYFFKNWKNQNDQLEQMIKRMDSSRNAFLKQFHPGLLESKKNN